MAKQIYQISALVCGILTVVGTLAYLHSQNAWTPHGQLTHTVGSEPVQTKGKTAKKSYANWLRQEAQASLPPRPPGTPLITIGPTTTLGCDKICQEWKATIPTNLRVGGALGRWRGDINGVWTLTKEQVNGAHVWEARRSLLGSYLYYTTDGVWTIGDDRDKENKRIGFVRSAKVNKSTLPTQVASWQVRGGKNEWAVQKLKVRKESAKKSARRLVSKFVDHVSSDAEANAAESPAAKESVGCMNGNCNNGMSEKQQIRKDHANSGE